MTASGSTSVRTAMTISCPVCSTTILIYQGATPRGQTTLQGKCTKCDEIYCVRGHWLPREALEREEYPDGSGRYRRVRLCVTGECGTEREEFWRAHGHPDGNPLSALLAAADLDALFAGLDI